MTAICVIDPDPSLSMTKPFILASNSPRRRELLSQIGLVFRVDPSDVDESLLPDEMPEAYAIRVAMDKARIVAARSRTGIVIAADTIVVQDRVIMGKPRDAGDAEQMLGVLSGKEHQVITGLVIQDITTGKTRAKSAVTKVWFRVLTSDEIAAYIASGEPLDKAGAYGIQGYGALLVDRIQGCYFNVVGLPLSLLGEMLKEFGVSLLADIRL